VRSRLDFTGELLDDFLHAEKETKQKKAAQCATTPVGSAKLALARALTSA
jgi:hypothetical protein